MLSGYLPHQSPAGHQSPEAVLYNKGQWVHPECFSGRKGMPHPERSEYESFPGGRPLKNRHNIVITRQNITIDGAEVVHDMEEAMEKSKEHERCFVIGGGTVYAQMLAFCDTAYITKVHVTPESDTFFPNLDENPDWYLAETLLSGEENGITYEMLLYKRK